MKRIISAFLAVLLLLCANVSAEKPITVVVDGNQIVFDASPVNSSGRILVPVRAIFETMGATVVWNAQTQTVSSRLAGDVVVMTIGQNNMKLNGENIYLDVPPQIVSGRTMVPVRAAAEAFGADVKWFPEENRVSIITDTFAENLKTVQHHTSEKLLTAADGTQKKSVFDVSYFPFYEEKTNAPDGTDFEVIATGDAYCAIFGISSDLYTGAENTLSAEYAQNIAKDMVTLTGGTLISSDVISVGDTQFMKIHYTSSGSAEDIYDEAADVMTYMTFSNGIVYNITLSYYGDVPAEVINNFNYMLNKIDIK